METVVAKIIVGKSFFGSNEMVGIALRDANGVLSTCAFTRLADAYGGRPCTVDMARGDYVTAARYLETNWFAWARRVGVNLAIEAGIERVTEPF